jgi:methylated-DNA-[protein]-cysteine S-methyltransferase
MQKKSSTSKLSDSRSFAERCYELLREIPAGKVTTYKEIARALGTKAFRAVGTAMNKNPLAPKVPCHRVVPSNGTLGGYAFGSRKKKLLLESEGISFDKDKIVNFNAVFYSFEQTSSHRASNRSRARC